MSEHLIKAFIIFLSFTVFYSCGPPKGTSKGCYPKDLQVDVNNGQMDIYWRMNCKYLISGYNIYINEKPIVQDYPGEKLPSSFKPFNNVPFTGDTNPDDGVEHFIAERLEDGKKYYVSVRIVNPDKTLSAPSNEVLAVCGARGKFELTIRYKSHNDGYDFEKNEYVRADNINNDIYFYSKDGIDYLVSPRKLDGFLKANKLKKLPLEGSFNKVRYETDKLSLTPDDESVIVKAGDWLLIKTPENKNALVNVLDISGSSEKRKIKLFFAFSPIPDELIF